MQDEEFSLARIDGLTQDQRHLRLMGWFVAEVYRQRENRERMAKCEGYYDQYQYDAARKAAIEARGQQAIVFDRIAPQIDWLIGTERRTRIDYRVDPRDNLDKATTQDALNKTKLLKWLDDTGGASFQRSRAFAIAMKAGLAWVEIQADVDQSSGSPVIEVHLSWREVLHDSFGSTEDPQTMRYIFRIKVVDLDLAVAHFPQKKEALLRVRQNAASLDTMTTWMNIPGAVLDLQALFGGGTNDQGLAPMPMANMFNGRDRVLLLEAWTREPMRKGPDGKRSTNLNDPVCMRPYVTIMTEHEIIEEAWSPYKHDRFPFIPVWAYRESRTGLPYSPVRRAIDKQDGLNNTMSRAHFEIATNQVVAEVGTFDDEVMTAEDVRTEVDDPNGTIILATGKKGTFEVRKGFDKAEMHLVLADRYAGALDEASSITRENTGRDSAPVSGIARQVKEAQGSVMSAELFDNLLQSHKWSGEIKLSVVEQYMVKPIAIPIPGERGQHEMLALNQPNADGTYTNDITERSARFVISEQPWRASLAAAQFSEMMELLTQLASVSPQVVLSILDLVFEFADIPNKQTFLERIRSVTGAPGPDNEITPEQQQAKEKQNAMAQAQFEAQLAGLQADVKEKQAQGAKLDSEAVLKRLESLYAAAQAAQIVQVSPAMAPMIDEVLRSAGWQDQTPGTTVTSTAGALPQPTPAQPQQPAAVPAGM